MTGEPPVPPAAGAVVTAPGPLLNGPLAPLGWRVGIVDARVAEVVPAVIGWRHDLDISVATQRVESSWPAALHWLEPLETPWARCLFIEVGERFTIFVNNHLLAGDPAAIVGMLAPALNRRALVASYYPMTKTGEALGEFQVFDPYALPPLHLLRSVTARAEAGEWTWHAGGNPLDYEKPERYTHPDIGQRLDRGLIVDYLQNEGIAIDDLSQYGLTILMTQGDGWERHTMTLDQARVRWGL